MKLIYSIFVLIIFLIPLSSEAAWYWLSNSTYPQQGDFVELNALEYAEFESNGLLTLVEDETKRIINKLERFKDCEEEYDSIINSYQVQSFEALNYWVTKGESCIAEEERLEKIQEALEECDIEYVIDRSSGSELVGYSDTIKECKKETEVSTPVTNALEIEDPSPAEEGNTLPAVSPVVSQTPPKQILQSPQGSITNVESGTKQVVEEDVSTTEVEQDEQLTSDNQVQVTEEPVQINFFQKIKNFFQQLFSW